MGEIKRRNRNLPHHTVAAADNDKVYGTAFFEQVVRQEVKRAMHRARTVKRNHAKPAR